MSCTVDLADRISDLTTDSVPDPPRPFVKDESNASVPHTRKVSAQMEGTSPQKRKVSAQMEGTSPQTPKVSAQVEEEIRVHSAPPQEDVKCHAEMLDEEKFESLPKENDKAPPPKNSKKSDKKKSGGRLPKSSQGAPNTKISIVGSQGIHIGSSISIALMSNASKESKDHPSTNMPSKAQINELRKCTDRITLRDIDAISGEIGQTWKDVGRELKCSESQMQQFYIDHSALGLKEVVIQMLLDWQRVNTVEASISNLCDALVRSDQGDALHALINFRTKLKN